MDLNSWMECWALVLLSQAFGLFLIMTWRRYEQRNARRNGQMVSRDEYEKCLVEIVNLDRQLNQERTVTTAQALRIRNLVSELVAKDRMGATS